MGWLRILSRWVGGGGTVVGGDIDVNLLQAAREFVDAEGLSNVEVVADDLFASKLEPASFDLVHARFQLAPLGRTAEQIATYRRLVRDGGTILLEDPDVSSLHFNPPARSAERLIALIDRAFSAAGGDLDAGRALAAEPTVNAHVLALPAGHPYLRLPRRSQPRSSGDCLNSRLARSSRHYVPRPRRSSRIPIAGEPRSR